MYYYIYKIVFNTGQFYIGSRKSKVAPEQDTKYWGSPITFKHLWEDSSLEKEKHIIQVCENFEEMRDVEVKLIKEAWKEHDDLCLNRTASPGFHPEVCKKAGKIGGKISKELGLGFHAFTKEQKSEHGKIWGKRNKELGLGIHGLSKEQRSENGKRNKELGLGIHGLSKEQRLEINKKSLKRQKELGVGFYGLSEEQRREFNRRGLKTQKELGLGVFGLTKEQRIENGKKGGSKSKELSLGFNGLTHGQRIENGKIGGKIAKELGLGIHGLSKEQRSENGKKSGKIGGKAHAEKYAIEYCFKSPNGEIVSGTNLTHLCKDNNLSKGNMHAVLNGQRKSHKGWTLP